MSIAAAISWILSNASITLFVVALVTTMVKTRRAHFARRVVTASYVFWGELLFYVVGVGLVIAGLLHAYAPSLAALALGGKPSPFEYDLGWAQVAIGLVALSSLWRGYEFRLAATIAAVVFGWAIGAQHLGGLFHANEHAGSSGIAMWLTDFIFPFIVLVHAWLSREAHERTERTY